MILCIVPYVTPPISADVLKYVTSDNGLRLRSQPGLKGKILDVIPYYVRVNEIEKQDKPVTINGIKGYWVKVKWNGKKGWVFDGYLRRGSQGEDRYRVVVDNLKVRKKPDLKSKIVAVLKECDEVIFLENTKTSVIINTGSEMYEAPLVKIRTLDGITGYVLAGHVEQYPYTNFTYNKSKFDIRGSWSQYIDPPTGTYDFYKNGKFRYSFHQYEKEPEYNYGTYWYDGYCNIKITYSDGRIVNLKVIDINGTKTLMDKCFIFNPEYYSKDHF